MFVIDKTKDFIYGFNYAVNEGTFVTVPLSTGSQFNQSTKIDIERVICSHNNQYFQLIVSSGDRKYLNTYFSFDGT